MIKKEKV
ncbi:hypothetical protein CP061683_0910A, partial [Chlamydia psittaci 06-1683]